METDTITETMVTNEPLVMVTTEPLVTNEPMVTTEPTLMQPNIIQLLQPRSEIDIQFDFIQQNLTKFKTNLSDIQQQLRLLEKTIKKDKKKETKPVVKQTKIIGFDIQENVTDELRTFMKMPAGSTTTRNAATTFITEYIRNNKLQDMVDRKRIHLNDELATLFKLTTTDIMTYFKLHKHISKMFVV